MGLDIRARNLLVALPAHDRIDECYEAGHIVIGESEEFPGRLGGTRPGCYRQSEGGETFHFRAGSYSGYNEWREQLCRMSLSVEPDEVWEDPQRFDGKPFYELINFSDCTGVIGAAVCANLAKDFREQEPKAFEHARKLHDTNGENIGRWFIEQYQSWRRAFELGADRGAVFFS